MGNYRIEAEEIQIGKHVTIEDGVYIGAKFGKKAKRVILGDGAFIGRDSKFFYPEFTVGDYTMIHNHAFGSGDKACHIGSCCWFGQNCVIDSEGGTYIGNGVGVGAYSQLWSHIMFGDVLQGCRFDSIKPLIVEDDVWFVGHCIVSPIHAKKKSMAMVGSVIVKDMDENRIYAGSPAKDMTDKMGHQYIDLGIEEKLQVMLQKKKEFFTINSAFIGHEDKIQVVTDFPAEGLNEGTSYFNVSTRTYTKTLSDLEYNFMKFLLVKIKFYPDSSFGFKPI